MADAAQDTQPLWIRASAPLRKTAAFFPWERALVMLVAAVVGLYGGIAAGLFATSIRFVQLVIYRGHEVANAVLGPEREMWARYFQEKLAAAHWHLEFAALAMLILVAAAVLEWLGASRRLPLFEAKRLRAVALAGALGLSLYYPLMLLRTFNSTFHETGGGLYELLLNAPRWSWVVGPALGALLAALVVRYLSPESGGHGVVEVIEAVHERMPIRGSVAVWKSLAAGLVIGSGGSAGREGPLVHLGGAVASSLSRFLALPRSETSLLLAAGAGAAIAASFQAPLAGSLFALEIVLADFDVRTFAPVVLACVTATATSRALLGGGTDLRPVSWTLSHPSEIAVYLVLGGVAALCGIAYVKMVHGAEEWFAHRVKLRPELKAAVGGLAVGVIALAAPRVMGSGIESMNAALAGQLALGALVLALVCKLIATACTLGSGSPGGSFFPAVFLGAMLGGAFGRAVHAALPSITAGADAYAAVGMGAVVAGATLAPLTGVLMMFELTGSYQIVLPLLVSCGTAAALVQSVLGGSIYTIGARKRGIRLARGTPSLRDLSVTQALLKIEPLSADLSFDELRRIVGPSLTPAFPVHDNGAVVGLLSTRDVRRALLDPATDPASTARSFARKAKTLLPDDDLALAVQRLSEVGEGLVLDDEGRALGIITRESILDAWRRATGTGAAASGHTEA